jgi:pyrroloquinoline quinone (PQQ) biosynthesis protein C
MSGGPNPFADVARRHPLWIHPFLGRCREGRLELWDVRTLATQMYRVVEAFPGLLASVLVRCDDEEVRHVVAGRLWDAAGGGDRDRAHVALFRRLTRALGIGDELLRASVVLPGTQRLIDTLLGLAGKHGDLAALGAVCHACEGIAPAMYRAILPGIERAAPVPREALAFFEAPAGAAAAALEGAVGARATTSAAIRAVCAAVREAMDARVAFFDDVLAASRGIAGEELFPRASEELA